MSPLTFNEFRVPIDVIFGCAAVCKVLLKEDTVSDVRPVIDPVPVKTKLVVPIIVMLLSGAIRKLFDESIVIQRMQCHYLNE